MDFLDFQILFRPFLAAILGAIIGLEREVKGKEAGLRTYSLVCLGACVFTILSFYSLRSLAGETGVELDPSRIIQAVSIPPAILIVSPTCRLSVSSITATPICPK